MGVGKPAIRGGFPWTSTGSTYGNFDGVEHVLVYQVGGESRSGKLPDWRRFKVSDMRDVRMLDEHFSPPPIATSRHMRWDVVFVRVEQEYGARTGGPG